MKPRVLLFALLLLCLLPLPFQAQDEGSSTFLSLRSAALEMETGTFYTVRIDVENVESFWATDITVSYDPTHLYIIGTERGSPVQAGDLWGEQPIFGLRNMVNEQQGEMRYAASLLNPADPVSGSGTLGTFQVVPLLAGDTQLTFASADLASVTFVIDEETGERRSEGTQRIAFTAELLQVSITGDPATPPPEVTATPTATATDDPALSRTEVTAPPTATELVNVTAAPRSPTPEPTDEVPAQSAPDSSTLLLLAVGLVVVSIVGIVVLFLVYRRR